MKGESQYNFMKFPILTAVEKNEVFVQSMKPQS